MEAVWAFRVRLRLENGISVQTGSGSLSNNMSPAEPWINGTLAVSKQGELTSSGLLRVSAMHLFVAAGKIIQLCSQLLAPLALKVLWKSSSLQRINIWTYCINHGVLHWLDFVLSHLFKLLLGRKRFLFEGQFFRPGHCFREAVRRKGFWEWELDGVPLRGPNTASELARVHPCLLARPDAAPSATSPQLSKMAVITPASPPWLSRGDILGRMEDLRPRNN